MDVFDQAFWIEAVRTHLGRLDTRVQRVCLLEACDASLRPGPAYSDESAFRLHVNNSSEIMKRKSMLHKIECKGVTEELRPHLLRFQARRWADVQRIMSDTSKTASDRVSSIKAVLGIVGDCMVDVDP